MAAFLPALGQALGIGVGLKSLFGGSAKAPAPPTVNLPVQGQLMDEMSQIKRLLSRPTMAGAGLSASNTYQDLTRQILASLRSSGLRGDTGAQGALQKGAGALAGELSGIAAQEASDQYQKRVQYAQLLHNLLTGQASQNLATYGAQLDQAGMQRDLDAGNIAALSQLAALLQQWSAAAPKVKPPAVSGGIVPPPMGAINAPKNTQLFYTS